jgi:hypothetical protein
MENKIKYDQYDAKGNLLQYTTKDGIPVSIIWGYNQTLPIAKVEGYLIPIYCSFLLKRRISSMLRIWIIMREQ